MEVPRRIAGGNRTAVTSSANWMGSNGSWSAGNSVPFSLESAPAGFTWSKADLSGARDGIHNDEFVGAAVEVVAIPEARVAVEPVGHDAVAEDARRLPHA